MTLKKGKKKYEKTCGICQIVFYTTSNKSKNCRNCSYRAAWITKARNGQLTKIVYKNCKICNKPITQVGSTKKDTCSSSCSRKMAWSKRKRKENIFVPCQVCGNNIAEKYYNTVAKKLKTCSIECKNKLLGQKALENKVSVVCNNCGNNFLKLKTKVNERNFCSKKCTYDSRKKEDALWRNSEYMNQYYRNYSHINREALYKRNTERRAALKSMKTKDANKVMEILGKVCLSCGSDSITIDHIVPLFNGGRHEVMNIQPLCRKCNSKKRTKTIDYRTEEQKQLLIKEFKIDI